MNICIVLNGEPSIEQGIANKIKKFDHIIAADGGANQCYHLGIVPDFIIGDLDSISNEVLDFFSEMKTQIVEAPSQYTLDFQEAIWLAVSLFSGEKIEQGLEDRRNAFLKAPYSVGSQKNKKPNGLLYLTVFSGLSDSEIDHTLGNIFVGISLPDFITLRFFKPDSDIFITKLPVTLKGEKNDIVSIIPLQKTMGLNCENLLYPVNNMDVDVGWLGSRNRMTGCKASIKFITGTLLIVVHHLKK